MSLSTCEHCGGHIPLGPDASNRCEKCGMSVWGKPEPMQKGPIDPADFAPIPLDPVLILRLTLGELTRTIIDLEDTRDSATKSIADIQERMESIRIEIRRINPKP